MEEQLRKSGAPKHIGGIPGGMSRSWLLGPGDCEIGRKRAHLRFGRRTGWRVFEQARTMVPHHLRCEGRPGRCSRADGN